MLLCLIGCLASLKDSGPHGNWVFSCSRSIKTLPDKVRWEGGTEKKGREGTVIKPWSLAQSYLCYYLQSCTSSIRLSVLGSDHQPCRSLSGRPAHTQENTLDRPPSASAGSTGLPTLKPSWFTCQLDAIKVFSASLRHIYPDEETTSHAAWMNEKILFLSNGFPPTGRKCTNGKCPFCSICLKKNLSFCAENECKGSYWGEIRATSDCKKFVKKLHFMCFSLTMTNKNATCALYFCL